jgi:hypothetical protein
MGLTTLGFGCAYLVAPEPMARLGGLAVTRPEAVAELRGYYGGLQVGMGVLFFLGLARPRFADAGLRAAAVLFAGNAAGRLLGVALAGGVDAFNLAGAVFELAFSAGSVWMLHRAGRAAREEETR